MQAMSEQVQPHNFTRQDRLDFVTQHDELWEDPKELVRVMREKGLYSSDTPAWDQVGYVMRAISKLRGEW